MRGDDDVDIRLIMRLIMDAITVVWLEQTVRTVRNSRRPRCNSIQ